MDITVFFANPSAWGIGLALIFGAVWLASLAPPKWRSLWVWLLFLSGAILFAPSIAWIQVPLQNLTEGWFINQFGVEPYHSYPLLITIPTVFSAVWFRKGLSSYQ